MADGRRIEGLYYELFAVDQGLDAAQAKAEAGFKAVDNAAVRAGRSVDEVAAKSGPALQKTTDDFFELTRATLRWESTLGMTGARVKDIAYVATTDLQRSYSRAIATIRQQLAEGLIDPNQARQQGRQAAEAFNQGLSEVIRGARQAGALESDPRGQDIFIALADQFKDVEQAGRSAGVSLTRLQFPLTTLTTQAVGARAGVGRLAAVLLTMGLGGAVTVGVTAGVAAIVMVYRRLTSAVREAREQVKRLGDALLEQAKAEFRATPSGQLAVARTFREVEHSIERRLALARQGELMDDPVNPGMRRRIVNQQRVLQLERELRDATVRREQAEKNFGAALETSQRTHARQLGELLRSGDATIEQTRQATELVRNYTAEIEELQRSGADDAETRQKIIDLRAMVAELTRAAEAAGKDADRAAEKAQRAREAFAAAIAAQTVDTEDNLEVQIDRLTRMARAAGLGVLEIGALVDELRTAAAGRLAREGEQFADELRKRMASLTLTQVDDLTLQLKEFEDALAERTRRGVPVDETLVRPLRAALTQAVELRVEAERLEEVLRRIETAGDPDVGGGAGFNAVQRMRELQEELDRARGARQSATTPEARAAAEARIAQVTAAIAKLQREISSELERQAALNAEIESRTLRIAGGLANAANAAFGLASALFGVDSAAAKVLGSIGQISGGIKDILTKARTAGPDGKAPGLGGLLGSAGGVISMLPGLGQIVGGAMQLASLLGKDKEEEARRRAVQRENTEAIRKLTERVGDLALNIRGTDLARVQRMLADPAFQMTPPLGVTMPFADNINRALGAILERFGMTTEQLQEFARQFGVAIGTGGGGKLTLQDFENLRKALSASEFTRFADTFAGQMERMRAEIALFDLKDPIQQFEALRRLLASVRGGTGLLDALLASLDLTTATGLEAAREMIRELFERTQTGAGLTAAELGGLTGQEFIDALMRLMGIVEDVARSGTVAGTGGYNISRSITEVTGNRVAALLATANVWQERQVKATEGIFDLLRGASPTIPLPTYPTGPQGERGSVVIRIENITVPIQGPVAPQEAPAIGRRIGRAAAAEISEALGREMMWRKRARGIM